MVWKRCFDFITTCRDTGHESNAWNRVPGLGKTYEAWPTHSSARGTLTAAMCVLKVPGHFWGVQSSVEWQNLRPGSRVLTKIPGEPWWGGIRGFLLIVQKVLAHLAAPAERPHAHFPTSLLPNLVPRLPPCLGTLCEGRGLGCEPEEDTCSLPALLQLCKPSRQHGAGSSVFSRAVLLLGH